MFFVAKRSETYYVFLSSKNLNLFDETKSIRKEQLVMNLETVMVTKLKLSYWKKIRAWKRYVCRRIKLLNQTEWEMNKVLVTEWLEWIVTAKYPRAKKIAPKVFDNKNCCNACCTEANNLLRLEFSQPSSFYETGRILQAQR